MGNKVRKILLNGDTFTAPAGVFFISALTIPGINPIVDGNMTSSEAALDTAGNAYGWGLNGNGQNGNGDVTPRSSPVAVLGGLKFVNLQSTVGGGSNFGLTAGGDLYAWGANSNGVLGVGDTTPRSSPVAVLGGLKFSDFSANSTFVLAITPSGDLYGWGRNTSGQIGNGDVVPRSSPVAVLGGLKFSKAFSVNGSTGFALAQDGTLYGFGINNNGQLGVGDIIPRSSPVAVLGGLKFVNLISPTGGTGYLGLTAGGSLYGWGLNSIGCLGVGDILSRSSPVAVLGGLTFTQISCGEGGATGAVSYGLAIGGDLYAWGANTFGQLGLGDVTPRSSPVIVLGGLKFTLISTRMGGSNGAPDGGSAIATTSDGTAYSWGGNTNGQLGLGDVIPRSSPVAVLGGFKFSLVKLQSANYQSTCGWDSLGNLYAWGLNANGQLGLGDVTPRSSPVIVLGSLKFSIPRAPGSIGAAATVQSSMSVVPGAAYAVSVTQGVAAYIGGVQVADTRAATNLVVEYEQ